MGAGLAIGTVGLAGLIGAGAGTPYALLVPPLVATGFGMALTMPAATSAVIDAAPPERAGIAAGVFNAARQLGGVVGVALLGSLAASGRSFEPGMRVAFALAAGAFALGGVVAAGAVRQRRLRRAGR
jgi:DHA2 family methylenomycin A resistance protein-like MFS transporter